MAKIIIHKDGSFESIATSRTYLSDIRDSKDMIASFKRYISGVSKHIKALKRIDELKKEAKHAQPKRKEKLKDMIAVLRLKHGLKPNATVAGAESKVRKAEEKIKKLEKKIERLTEYEADRKERLKKMPVQKASTKLPKLDGTRPAPKVRIVPAADKKTGNTLAKMQASYAEITEQLKRDMPPSKKSRLRSERARLRVMIAELKRGQKAANKKATENKAKPSGNMGSSKSKVVPKSGMGSAKKTK